MRCDVLDHPDLYNGEDGSGNASSQGSLHGQPDDRREPCEESSVHGHPDGSDDHRENGTGYDLPGRAAKLRQAGAHDGVHHEAGSDLQADSVYGLHAGSLHGLQEGSILRDPDGSDDREEVRSCLPGIHDMREEACAGLLAKHRPVHPPVFLVLRPVLQPRLAWQVVLAQRHAKHLLAVTRNCSTVSSSACSTTGSAARQVVTRVPGLREISPVCDRFLMTVLHPERSTRKRRPLGVFF